MLSPLLLPLLLSRLVLLPRLLTRLGQGLSRLAAVCTGDRLVGLLTGGGRRTEARPGARAVAGVAGCDRAGRHLVRPEGLLVPLLVALARSALAPDVLGLLRSTTLDRCGGDPVEPVARRLGPQHHGADRDQGGEEAAGDQAGKDRKSTRLNSSH